MKRNTARAHHRRKVGGRALAILVMALLAQANAAAAQTPDRHWVRGVVTDSAGAALHNAMVVVLSRPDSVLAEYTLSSQDGRFTIEGLPAGGYILQVTLIGYRTLRRDFDVANAGVDAGRVALAVTALEVDSVVVSVEHVPFVNQRDTFSYNVQAFPTPPNATVEELLRRLPGIDVDADGSITAQGEAVAKILVDGKEFFGDDPTVAMENLPADAIEQIAVYDKESDMAEFTGIPDGEEERTINLKLKEEAKAGYFGRARGDIGGDGGSRARLTAPVGSEARYNGSLSLNRFSPTIQLALTANANNVNQGRSRGGFPNLAAGMPGGGGGRSSDGLTETMSLGVNGSREFSEETWLRGSYTIRELDNLQDRSLQQRALFGSDVASLVDQTSKQEAGNVSHRLDLNGQLEFSEGHELRLRMRGNARSSSLTSFANRQTHTLGGDMLNSATTDYFVDGNELGGDGRLTWRRRLNEEGRSIVAELTSDLEDSDVSADLSSLVTGERRTRDGEDDAGGVREILQDHSRVGWTRTNSARLSLTQPLAEGHTVELFGQRNATHQDRNNAVYDRVDGTLVHNPGMSSGFERAYTYFQGGTRYSRNTETSWLTLGIRLQRSNLEGVILGRGASIANGYTHLLANARLKKEIKEGQTLQIRYDGSSREPSLTQLQPYADNTDPLNVYSGNPDLSPEYRHRVNADFRLFNEVTFINLRTFTRFTYTDNNISMSRVFDERGFQTRMPVNTSGEWSGSLGANFDTPIRRLGIDVELEYDVSYSEGTELVNHAANESRILRNSLEIGVDNREKDRIDVRASVSFNFNDVAYSLNQELDRGYVNSQYRAEATWHIGDAWTLESDFRHRVFDQGLFGDARNVARWDAAISRRVLDERAEIELRAYDLLNQNQGVAITNSANYIQESRTDSLGQYFMLRVMYRLGTPMNRRGSRRGR
ncbi:MAG: TonB-dependent receptor [Gammaproteobacteria bacterium]|nr:TonB-dependent receptor [Gammaproteobacteria bacterium]